MVCSRAGEAVAEANARPSRGAQNHGSKSRRAQLNWSLPQFGDPLGGALVAQGDAEFSQEVHLGVAFGLAVLAPEVDRDIPIGTHLDGMGAPEIRRSGRPSSLPPIGFPRWDASGSAFPRPRGGRRRRPRRRRRRPFRSTVAFGLPSPPSFPRRCLPATAPARLGRSRRRPARRCFRQPEKMMLSVLRMWPRMRCSGS